MSGQKTTRVAINGFGRIGRSFFRLAQDRDDLEVVAINDLGDIENLVYLLKYDTAQGRRDYVVAISDDRKGFTVDGRPVAFLSEKEPAHLPWGDWGVDVVVESTGFFTEYSKARAHIDAGARHVVISAPAKGDSIDGVQGETVLMGVNQQVIGTCQISSNASCTTNAGSPIIAIMDESIGIEKAMLSTVHGYTASQGLVDGPSKKDFRLGRAAAQNIVPTSTGAAIATTEVHTQLKGKFDGIAIRIPVITGSISDITFLAKRNTSIEEVNDILEKAGQESRWRGVYSATREPLVSSDIIGLPCASIADLSMTRVVDGNLVKVMAWYDNETGYTSTLVQHVVHAGRALKG